MLSSNYTYLGYWHMMGGNYPLDLAVVALEQCRDNLEVAAVWLLDNAVRELY